ncbi:MAG: thioredoxin family protein [Ferruginibacter sp.]
MQTFLNEPGIFTYESYLAAFEKWVHNGQTSYEKASLSLIEFTKLNWARTQRLHKTSEIIPELKTAIENLQHNYSWMVITEAWCGDSAQNLPVIAEIAKLNPEKIKLNVALRDENPDLMSKYLTNGAKAIPKVIGFDETLKKVAFVWGPRPEPAQQLLLDWKQNPNDKSWEDFEKQLHGWYAKDRTHTLQTEFVKILTQLQ